MEMTKQEAEEKAAQNEATGVCPLAGFQPCRSDCVCYIKAKAKPYSATSSYYVVGGACNAYLLMGKTQ